MISLICAFIEGIESLFGLLLVVIVVAVFVNVTGLGDKIADHKEAQRIEKEERASQPVVRARIPQTE